MYYLFLTKIVIAASWIAVRELGYSGADVARYLGVTNSYLNLLITSALE